MLSSSYMFASHGICPVSSKNKKTQVKRTIRLFRAVKYLSRRDDDEDDFDKASALKIAMVLRHTTGQRYFYMRPSLAAAARSLCWLQRTDTLPDVDIALD